MIVPSLTCPSRQVAAKTAKSAADCEVQGAQLAADEAALAAAAKARDQLAERAAALRASAQVRVPPFGGVALRWVLAGSFAPVVVSQH